MKVLKWILILVVIFVLIIVAGLAYVLNSASFQQSFVEKALKEEATVQEFGYFKAGLSNLKLESLTLEKDGNVITLGDVEVKYSLVDALFNKEIRVDELKASGLLIDLRGVPQQTPSTTPSTQHPATPTSATRTTTNESPTEKPASPPKSVVHSDDDDDNDEAEPFQGLFTHGALPFKLYLGTVDIEAKVLLPNGREVDAKVTGGGIEPDTTGDVALSVKFIDATPGAEIMRAEVDAKLALTQNADSEITRIVLEMDVESESTKVKNTPKLALKADLSQQPNKTESYVISLTEAARKGKPLAELDASYDPADERLKGKAHIQAGHEQVVGLVPSDKTPDFAMDGEIDFDVGTVSGVATLDAKIKVVLDELTRVRGELAGLGKVTVTTALAADSTKHAVTLNTLNMQVISTTQGQLMTLENLQRVIMPTKEGAPLPKLEGDLIRLVLNQLPFSLIDPWVEGTTLSGQPLSTTIVVSGEGEESYKITAPKGLAINGLTVSKDGQPILDDVSIASSPTIVYTPSMVRVDLAELKMTSGGIPLVSGQANVAMNPKAQTMPNGQVAAALAGDLAQLLKQPVLDAFNNVSVGTFDSQLNIDFDQRGDFTLKTDVKGMMTRQPMKQISRLSVDAKGRFNPPAHIEIATPFKLNTSEGNTDVTLDATIKQPDSDREFDVTLKGPQLDTDGMMLLAAAFKNPNPRPVVTTQPAASQPTTPTRSAQRQMTEQQRMPLPMGPGPVKLGPDGRPWQDPDKVPFWSGNTGTAEVVVDKLYYKQFRLDDATVKLDMAKDKLVVDPLAADFAGAPLKADTTITFTSGYLCYDLNSNLTFKDFEVGKFLVQEKPGATPPITGLFNINGGAFSKGPNMPTLLQEVQGKFNLEGRDGKLRVLAAAGQQNTGAALGIGLGIASLFSNNKTTAVNKINQLIQMLQEIPYDRFAIIADRDKNLDINLSEIALTGPEIRLNGTGKVTYVNGTAIPNQPLKADVDLKAKGATAKLLSDAALLSGPEDEDGFREAFIFPVTGTLSKPNFSALSNRLTSAAVSLATNGGGSSTPAQGTEGQKPEGETETKKNDGAEAVKGILNSLFK